MTGFCAEARKNGRHLRLLSVVTFAGEASCVFDVAARQWIACQWAGDFEDGKRKAEAVARDVLGELPPIEWCEAA